jgi:hypothetical protein
MKAFISWSGEQSRHIAESLRDWLPAVIQSVIPWVSSQDIDKGSRSLEEINSQLTDTSFGIVCLTPQNLDEKWIHFEAGALSKAPTTGPSRIWTYLYDVKYADVQGPLSQFQHTIADKADTKKLITAINKVSDKRIEDKTLDMVFDRMWPDFEGMLQRVPRAKAEVPTKRSADSMIEELLELVRGLSRREPIEDVPLFLSTNLGATLGEGKTAFIKALKATRPSAKISLYFFCPNCEFKNQVEIGTRPTSTDLFNVRCDKCGWTGEMSSKDLYLSFRD